MRCPMSDDTSVISVCQNEGLLEEVECLKYLGSHAAKRVGVHTEVRCRGMEICKVLKVLKQRDGSKSGNSCKLSCMGLYVSKVESI